MPEARKILVVDDEVVIRELLTDVLEDAGYEVGTASSGPEALDLMTQSSEFVLLFTDIMMPGMGGIELIREAKKVRPSVIPIVMTAYATLESARAAVKEGAYDYVLKPFSLSEVRLAVANALERHRLANENARLLELTELFRISEQLATIHDEQQLFDYVLKAALERVGATRGSLMVRTPDGESLEIRASEGIPEGAADHVVQVNKSISGLVATTAQPLLVEDMKRNPEVARMSRRLEFPSFISVPLERKMPPGVDRNSVSKDMLVTAVLNVSRKDDGSQFSESDLKTLRIVANHASAALDNVRLIRDIEASHLSTIESMALLLEARDPYTQDHSRRVRDTSVAIAAKLGMLDKDIEMLRLGAAFHDIGKVGVPDHVLNKPGRLESTEWQQIRRHPVIGYDVIEPIHFIQQGHLEIVRGHHERIDGSGYPDGLEGDAVSPLMRIIAVADSYDAMASNRAYRQALSDDVIVAELTKCQGAKLDSGIVKILMEMMKSGEIHKLG